MTEVSIIKCANYEQSNVDKAITKAFARVDNLDKKIKGRKILIKPNILMGKKPEFAVSTHPTVIEAICKILKKHDCEVVIGESSGWNTRSAFEISGIKGVADNYGIKIIVFDDYETEDISIDGKVLKSVTLTKALKDFDYVINACKMKTHSLMKMTGAVKNCYGFVPGKKKAFYHTKGSTEKLFGEMLIDIYGQIKPKILLNVMDAVVGMEGEGPGNGDPKNTGLILSSTDASSLDMIASQIMGFKLKEIESINAAVRRHDFNIKDVKVVGEVSALNKPLNYKRPGQGNIINAVVTNIQSIISPKNLIPEVDKGKCIKCSICAKNCPVNCITLEPYPVFDRSVCIECYCCHEHCPKGAIFLKKS